MTAHTFVSSFRVRCVKVALAVCVLLVLAYASAMAGGADTAGAASAVTAQTTAPTLLRATPHAAPGDGSTRGSYADRVTISPNGDSINDAAELVICGTAQTRVRLRVFHWGHGRHGQRSWDEVFDSSATQLVRSNAPGCGKRGRAVLSWHGQIGLTTGDQAPDSAYRVSVCTLGSAKLARSNSIINSLSVAETGALFLASLQENIDDHGQVPSSVADQAVESNGAEARETGALLRSRTAGKPDPAPFIRPEGAQGCIARPLLVDVRRASISVSSTASFRAGTSVPLNIQLDARRTQATVQIEGGGSPAGNAIASGPASASRLNIPDVLSTGLYRIRLHVPATDSAAAIDRCTQIVVRASSFSVNNPPPNSALVVWPYLTWRAYNQFDADNNGIADTWYSRWKNRTVSLTGPHERLAQGNGCSVSQPFTDWAQAAPGHSIQSITDVELGRLPKSVLHRYRSIWFPDHTEYYEVATYRKLLDYRKHGGNLVFLSANSFFRRVKLDQHHNIERLAVLQERKDVTSDYRLEGVGFDACCFPRSKFGSYVVQAGTTVEPWVLDGTGLQVGDSFGTNGVEVDKLGPRFGAMRVSTIAQSSMFLRPGLTAVASMVHIRWPGGGTTFATGNLQFTIMLLSSTRAAVVAKILDNVWEHTTGPATVKGHS